MRDPFSGGTLLTRFAPLAVALLLISCTTQKNPQTGSQSSSLSPSPAPATYAPRIGVGVSTGSRTCIAIANANIASNAPVTLVSPMLPQTFIQAEIGGPSSSPCPVSKGVDPAISSYDVHVTGGSIQKLTPLIAVLGTSAPFSMSNNNVQADIDQNGKTELFRACRGNDGIHLTIWSGTPLTGSVLWHGYYYDPSNAAAGPPCTTKEE